MIMGLDFFRIPLLYEKNFQFAMYSAAPASKVPVLAHLLTASPPLITTSHGVC